MVSIGNINIGRKEKRAFFPLNHDVNTTSDFGFCQPTLIRHFIKGSKISLKSKTGVRLSALPCPTFGRIECKQHTAFVPVKDVFEAFDYQQANKSVSSALRSYIPTTTDYCQNIDFLRWCFDIALGVSDYYYNDFNKWLSLLPFRLSLWVPVDNLLQNGFPWLKVPYPNLFKNGEYVDIFNDVRIYGENSIMSYQDRQQCYAIGMFFLSNLLSPLTQQFFNGYNLNIGWVDYDGKSLSNQIKLPLSLFSYPYNSNGIEKVDSDIIGNYVYNGKWAMTTLLSPDLPGTDYKQFDESEAVFWQKDLKGLSDSRLNYIFNPFSVENADYMFKLLFNYNITFPTFGGVTDNPITWQPSNSIALGLHLTPNGKRLFKVFNACRIHFGRSHNVSMNSILAYYKVWFDKYNAGRNIQWRDTNAYKLIHTYYDTGVPSTVIYHIDDENPYDFISDKIIQNLRYNLLHFLTDLYDCNYCSKLDNITVATDSPVLESGINDNSNYIDIDSGSYIQPYSEGAGQTFNIPTTKISNMNLSQDDSQPYYRSYDSTGLSVRFMQTIYKLVNKNSVLGSKVDDYLRAHGIANGLPKTKVLGDSSFMCNIDDVYGTVNNDSTALGEYAGRGLGSSEGDNKSAPTMKFECDEYGYLIQLTTIVPLGGYVQGDTQDPISRYDFYQSEFDGLGMEVLPQSAVIGRQTCFGIKNPDTVFGFVPRYMSLKVQNNLANGGFAFNSESAQFLPYSLDKIFSVGSPSEFIDKSYLAPTQQFAKDLVCDEELRYIGRYEKFGNFDRIFYDTLGITDNFIVHIVQELSMYAPMRPIDNSFDTYDEFNDDSSVALEHA